MWALRITETQKGQEKTKIPPVAFIGGWLKVKIAFCSKHVVLLAKEVN